MGSTEQKTLQTILQAIIDQGNLTVTEVNASVGSGTDSLEVVKNIKLQELAGAAGNHTITLEAKAQELVKYISEQGFRIRINQANHGFTFNPIQYDTGLAKYVKATKDNPADAMAIKVDNDNFDLVTSGSYPLSSGIKDVFGKDLVEDEYYFLDENVAGGFTPIKPIHIYQPLFLVAKDKGKLRALIEVETPTDLEPRILNAVFDEQVERVINTADEKIEEIEATVNQSIELLQPAVDLANETRLRLETTQTEASEMQHILNGTIDIGEDLLIEINGENNSAVGNVEALKGKITQAEITRNNLNTSNSVAGTTNSTLRTTINVADSTTSYLLSSNTTANNTLSTLNAVIRDGEAKRVEINNAISSGTQKINEINAAGTSHLNAVNTAGTTNVKSVNDAGTAKVKLVNDAGTTQVSNVTASGVANVDSVNQARDVGVATLDATKVDGIEKIVEVADAKIAEIESLETDTIANVLDGTRFRHWLGSPEEFEGLGFKEVETKYDMYGSDGAYVGGRYWKNLIPSEYYDPRISMIFDVNSRGIHHWNNPNDPMPIKTINMAGLQKWEETDDYIIYLDKDAVMTTVTQYATGTYDLFKERKADIDGSMELLKINNIEWTSEDDSKLLLDINKAQLERIANTPVTMEEDAVPQTFTTRAVPTTYECCFRVDKKSGEIYIGEGYENLFVPPLNISNVKVTKFDNYDKVEITVENYPRYEKVGLSGSKYSFITEVLELVDGFLSSVNGAETDHALKLKIGYNSKVFTMPSWGASYGIWHGTPKIGDYILLRNLQLTKTDTPKPFVKSIMPSGKLEFVTNATSETHSFLYKENVSGGHGGIKFCTGAGSSNGRETVEYLASSFNETLDKVADIIISKSMCKFKQLEYSDFTSIGITLFNNGITNGITNLKYANSVTNRSFKQLLIYKGNLTEAELKTENEKDIRLK